MQVLAFGKTDDSLLQKGLLQLLIMDNLGCLDQPPSNNSLWLVQPTVNDPYRLSKVKPHLKALSRWKPE